MEIINCQENKFHQWKIVYHQWEIRTENYFQQLKVAQSKCVERSPQQETTKCYEIQFSRSELPYETEVIEDLNISNVLPDQEDINFLQNLLFAANSQSSSSPLEKPEAKEVEVIYFEGIKFHQSNIVYHQWEIRTENYFQQLKVAQTKCVERSPQQETTKCYESHTVDHLALETEVIEEPEIIEQKTNDEQSFSVNQVEEVKEGEVSIDIDHFEDLVQSNDCVQKLENVEETSQETPQIEQEEEEEQVKEVQEKVPEQEEEEEEEEEELTQEKVQEQEEKQEESKEKESSQEKVKTSTPRKNKILAEKEEIDESEEDDLFSSEEEGDTIVSVYPVDTEYQSFNDESFSSEIEEEEFYQIFPNKKFVSCKQSKSKASKKETPKKKQETPTKKDSPKKKDSPQKKKLSERDSKRRSFLQRLETNEESSENERLTEKEETSEQTNKKNKKDSYVDILNQSEEQEQEEQEEQEQEQEEQEVQEKPVRKNRKSSSKESDYSEKSEEQSEEDASSEEQESDVDLERRVHKFVESISWKKFREICKDHGIKASGKRDALTPKLIEKLVEVEYDC